MCLARAVRPENYAWIHEETWRDTCVLELMHKLDMLMSAGLLVLKQKKCICPRQPQHTGDTEISRQLRREVTK